MSLHRGIKLFAARPWSSAVLAAVMLSLGLAFVSGWVPISANRRYFPGHEWFMALLCWAVALFLVRCARAGLRDRHARKDLGRITSHSIRSAERSGNGKGKD
jgi:hypothetical protein